MTRLALALTLAMVSGPALAQSVTCSTVLGQTTCSITTAIGGLNDTYIPAPPRYDGTPQRWAIPFDKTTACP